MKNFRNLFHYISYLQYPLMVAGLYFVYKPLIFGYDSIWADYNKSLIFFGLAISFSTLQDPTKTQDKLSKRIWENARRAKVFLIYLVLLILVTLIFGMCCLLLTTNAHLKELSFGIISLSIGLIGLLKSGLEIVEHHRQG